MIRWSEYAPVSWLGWTIPAGQGAFDEFDGEFSDPLVNAGGKSFCVRFAVRASRARGGFHSARDFREGRVCVVRRGWWRRDIEAACCFGHELGDADRVQVKVVKKPAFVLNGSDRKFKPLCDKTSHNFQRRVSSLETVSTTCGSTDCLQQIWRG